MDRPEPNSLFLSLSSFFDEGIKRFERRRDFLVVVGVLVGVGSSFSFGGMIPRSWRFSSDAGGWCDERSCWINFGELLLSPRSEIKPPLPIWPWDIVEHFVSGLLCVCEPSRLDRSLLVLFIGRWWLDDDKPCCLFRELGWEWSLHNF